MNNNCTDRDTFPNVALCAKHGFKVDLAIEGNKTAFFDNEVVRGTLTITAKRGISLRNPTIALLCRYSYRERAGFQDATIYMDRMIMDTVLELPAGEHIFNFDFVIPEGAPASFKSTVTSTGCLWTVKFLFNDNHPLGVITKSTLLWPLPGFAPTAQDALGRVEARVSKDVFRPEESIECTVSALTPSSVHIKGVKARLVQRIYVARQGTSEQVHIVCDDQTVLDSIRTDNIPITRGITNAQPATKLSLRASNMRTSATRSNTFAGVRVGATSYLPAPSSKAKWEGTTLEVRYEVQVKIEIRDGKDSAVVRLALPVSLESPKASFRLPRNSGFDVQDLDALRIFPRIDLPPTYGMLDTHSEPTFHTITISDTASCGSDDSGFDATVTPAALLSAPPSYACVMHQDVDITVTVPDVVIMSACEDTVDRATNSQSVSVQVPSNSSPRSGTLLGRVIRRARAQSTSNNNSTDDSSRWDNARLSVQVLNTSVFPKADKLARRSF